MKINVLLLALIAAFGAEPIALFGVEREVFLETSRNKAEKLLVAVAEPERSLPLSIPEVLRADLVRTGLIRIVDLPPTPGIVSDRAGDGSPNFGSGSVARARRAGAQFVATVEAAAVGEEIILDAFFYETAEGTLLFAIRYLGKAPRALAHRFANEILTRLFGERGIAESRIAYVSERSGKKELYLMDYDGANKIRLTSDQSIVIGPRWAPDGNRITLTSYRDDNPDLYIFDLLSGRFLPLSTSPGLNVGGAWSPDGLRIAFTKSRDGDSEIYVTTADRKETRRLTFNRASDLSPTWSPTGRQLAFTSDRGGTPQIYVTDADGTNVRRLTFSGDYNTSPAWSPSGDKIAYACRNPEGRMKICLVTVDGSEIFQVTPDGPWDDESPTWSASGREMAFSSTRLSRGDIYTVRPDGSALIRLTDDGARNQGPAWSP